MVTELLLVRSRGKSVSLRLLAIASKGGHWEQLMLLRPALEGAQVTFACTDYKQGAQFAPDEFYPISDYNRNNPLQVLKGAWEMLRLVRRIRPDVVISTGAAPGLVGLVAGRILGAKTIWVDSVANSQEMSLSGAIACKFCHLTLTQWEHLADGLSGRTYWGSVI